MQFFGFEGTETVHQRCVLIRGHTTESTQDGHVLVQVTGQLGDPVSQAWPMTQGYFKALVMLSPGKNEIFFESSQPSSSSPSSRQNSTEEGRLILDYVPLLQLPPLHLAIMIAKDSSLQMDCPPWKGAGFTSTHSGLEAAIAKFRTTAYMWQAMTADDMHSKGLGRRSFRLDEEWAVDTTLVNSIKKREDRTKWMNSMAKVHLIRSDKTLDELLDKVVAQEPPSPYQPHPLHRYFENALMAQGGVFDSSTRPVVAGLILDSHYEPDERILLGHAAASRHKPDGLSLGIFGSHLTYSWPRFLEEIPSCLTDTTPPGDTVCNEHDECGTAWEACAIGQGAFLHEVGRAFGAPYKFALTPTGYASHWPRNFVSGTAYCSAKDVMGEPITDGKTPNDSRWSLRDALRFRSLPHFCLPEDEIISDSDLRATPSVIPAFEEDEKYGEVDLEDDYKLIIRCPAGITSVDVPGLPIPLDDDEGKNVRMEIDLEPLSREKVIPIHVLGSNGREFRHPNVWKLIQQFAIRVPDSKIRLRKQAISVNPCARYDNNHDESDVNLNPYTHDEMDWAFLLTEKDENGQLTHATGMDLYGGCITGGATVSYADGHIVNCGPVLRSDEYIPMYGARDPEHIPIPSGVDIAKFQAYGLSAWACLNGIRVTLSNGDSAGNSSAKEDYGHLETLEPRAGQRIVGLCGRGRPRGNQCTQFGIITAPKGVELPPQVYDMAELRNRELRAVSR